MLMHADPFRDFDRLSQQLLGGTRARPAAMPMDAYREGDTFVAHLDLPGIDADSIDLEVEQNTLTVRAERPAPAGGEGREMIAAERPSGTFTRQMWLGDALDSNQIQAHYSAGVLTLRIPVAEQAKPRKVAVTGSEESKQIQG